MLSCNLDNLHAFKLDIKNSQNLILPKILPRPLLSFSLQLRGLECHNFTTWNKLKHFYIKGNQNIITKLNKNIYESKLYLVYTSIRHEELVSG